MAQGTQAARAAQVALSTGSVYTYGTERVFGLAARTGYDGVELLVDERWDTCQPEYLGALVARHGVPILSVHSPFVPIPTWPRDEIGRVKRALSLAEAVGARTLNLHVPRRSADLTLHAFNKRFVFPFLPPPEDQRRFSAWLLDGGLEALQGQTEVTIVVENLPARRFLGTRIDVHALNTWEELSLLPRLCLDTTHCGTWGADPAQILERLGNRVQHVHLSDWNGRYQHQSIGNGHLPLDRFLQKLAERSYRGVVVVELTPQGLPAHDEAKLEAELRRNLEFCRRHLGQSGAAGSTTGQSVPSTPSTSPALPAAPPGQPAPPGAR